MQIELGTLEESYREYRRLIDERKKKAGNLTWTPEWEAELTQRERDIIQLWSGLARMIK